MAIIIVAMYICAFVAIGSYVMHKINLLKKRERNFYDMLSLVEFFQWIEDLELWQDFIQNTETITVIRRKITEQEECERELKASDYICYDFCFGNQKHSIYQEIFEGHKRINKSFFRGSYRCKMDLIKKKMFFYGTFDRKIFIDNFDVACQTLLLVYETEEMNFKSDFEKYIVLSRAIKESINWINENKNNFIMI